MKKAQSEIITTVLLVLIALAAVAIIAVFITNQVRQGAATADAKAQCLKIDLEVTKTTATQITVKNNGETLATGATMLAIVDGTAWGDTPAVPASLTTGVIAGTGLPSGKKVEVGVKLADKTACPMKTTYTSVV